MLAFPELDAGQKWNLLFIQDETIYSIVGVHILTLENLKLKLKISRRKPLWIDALILSLVF